MRIKQHAKKVLCLKALVRAFRGARRAFLWTMGAGKFTRAYSLENRSTGADTLMLVLAGYKPRLWPAVFGRLKRYLPEGIDVCVATSGTRNEAIAETCRTNGWSYLATERNNISLIQNVAIKLHPSAEWIYKMDEDMYLTEGTLRRMKEKFLSAPDEISAEVGFVAPLIPVNGYGHVRLLRELGLQERWESRFGRLMYTEGLKAHTQILKNPACARFMWGETEPRLADVDALNRAMASNPRRLSVCPYRFSIGLLLFRRELWKDMEYFGVDPCGTNLGLDEEQLCQYCMLNARAIVIDENSVVGHFAYGPQTRAMLDYLASNAALQKCLDGR